MPREVFSILLFVSSSALFAAGEPALVGDFRQDLSPIVADRFTPPRSSTPVDFQGRTYFVLWDDLHGRELWTTDGTAAGTAFFADLRRGPGSSGPGHLRVAGERLFFFADDGVAGPELWATDGTVAGTGMVADLNPGALGWYRVEALALGSKLVFIGRRGTSSTDPFFMYSSDGTASGTVLLSEVTESGLEPPLIARLGDQVLFGFEGTLRRTDGTPEGTRAVADLRTSRGPSSLVTLGDRTFFTRLASLFVTDGTEEGTKNLRYLDPDVEALAPSGALFVNVDEARELVDLDGTVYFLVDGRARLSATESQNICTLWRTDATPEGTRLVTRLLPTSGTRCPLELLAHRGLLYFGFITPDEGEELWVSDGTAAGTRRLLETRPGRSGGVHALRTFGEHVFFTTSTDLWRTDGTLPGTALFRDGRIVPERSLGGLLLLSTSPDGRLVELSRSDGTDSGTALFAEVPVRFSSSHPVVLAELGGEVFLTARDDTGERIHKVESGGGLEVFFESLDGELFGFAEPEGAVFGDQLAFNADGLLVSDGTAASLRRLGDGLLAARRLEPIGDRLYFAGETAAESTEPWISDGTEEGTRLVKALVPGGDVCCITPPISGASYPDEMTSFGDRVLFTAGSGGTRDLWLSDGTGDGTLRLTSGSPAPTDLAVLGSRALFAATSPELGRELWVTDATPEGTALLADLAPDEASSFPSGLTAFGDFVYFVTGNPTAEGRLYRTDGTVEGTVLVHDLAVAGPARIEELTAVGPQLFFVATTPGAGRELWVSDGEPSGTRLVKDLFPGAASSDPRSLTPSGPSLLFSATDAATGVELWQSDGTEEGTVRLTDLNPGPRSSTPDSLRVVGSRVFFAAASEPTGRELWSLTLSLLFSDGFETGDMSLWSAPPPISKGEGSKMRTPPAPPLPLGEGAGG